MTKFTWGSCLIQIHVQNDAWESICIKRSVCPPVQSEVWLWIYSILQRVSSYMQTYVWSTLCHWTEHDWAADAEPNCSLIMNAKGLYGIQRLHCHRPSSLKRKMLYVNLYIIMKKEVDAIVWWWCQSEAQYIPHFFFETWYGKQTQTLWASWAVLTYCYMYKATVYLCTCI